jgi:hypothetical protein
VSAGSSPGSDADHVERELKLDADPEMPLPDLGDVLEGVQARELAPLELDATYFDADDLRLLDAGLTVRRRSGEGTRWTVKLPAGPAIDHAIDQAECGDPPSSLARREVDLAEIPGASPGEPPHEIGQLVAPWMGDAAWSAVARLVTHRHRVELVRAGIAVAEVDDDRVSVRRAEVVPAGDAEPEAERDDEGEVGCFREIEVELGPGADRELVDAVLARLVASGARPGRPRAKVDRALDLLGGR